MKVWRSVVAGVVCTLWLLAFAPIWLWSSMLIEAILTWRVLGHWPGYSRQPDTGTYQRPAQITAAIICTILALGIPLVTRRHTLAWHFLAAMTGFVVLWVAAYLLFRFDPWGVLDWAMD